MSMFRLLAADLGQTADFSAFTALEAEPTQVKAVIPVVDAEYRLPAEREVIIDGLPVTFRVRHLDRLPLGTSYPEVIGYVHMLMKRMGPGLLVVDRTGVGAPVCDAMELAGLDPLGVTLTGGENARVEGMRAWVPKRDAVSALVMASQQRRIHIARGLPLHPIIQQELLSFETHFTAAGHDAYEGRGQHDDLVMALAIGVWVAEAIVNQAAADAVGGVADAWADVDAGLIDGRVIISGGL